jgi:general secretion pathway protein G
MILRNEERRMSPALRAAFTLMEMMIVVAILVVLVGIAVPTYMNYLEKAKLKRARADVETLSNAVKMFYADHGEWPQQLIQLVQVPAGKPYVKITALKDPWEQDYQMSPGIGQNMTALGEDVPDVFSLGPPGHGEVIGNWMRLR